MRKDYTKSGFLSFAITIWALICAVFVGFFPNFSWMMLIAILIPIVGALLFSGYYNKSGLTLQFSKHSFIASFVALRMLILSITS